MRLIDADALIETIEDHVTTVSCCPTVDWSMGKTQMKKQVIEDIRNAPTVNGWISVKDRMPNDFKPVFVWIGVGSSIRSGVPFVGKYNIFNGEWLVFGLDADRKEIIKITHWMPLLEPPKEE